MNFKESYKIEILEEIIECMPDGIIICDSLGKVVAANHRAKNLFQYDNQSLIGEKIDILVPDSKQGDHATHRRKFMSKPAEMQMAKRQILLGKKRDGSEFPAHISLVPIDTPYGVHIISTVRDMTDYHQLHERLLDSEKELRRVTEEQLASVQEELAKSEKLAALGALVSGFTHEICSPIGVCLTSINYMDSSVRSIKSDLDSGSLKESSLRKYIGDSLEAIEISSINLDRTLELIKSFKVVSVDQISEDKRVFNVKEYIEKIILSLKPKLKSSSHRVCVSCPDDIVIDSYPGALSQIVSNLIENSLIHGFDGKDSGDISINVKVIDREMEIEYQDNGVGISVSDQENIFNKFYTTKRDSGGSGLGLNVVYNLVSGTLGGNIECSSRKGEGVTFTIRFNPF